MNLRRLGFAIWLLLSFRLAAYSMSLFLKLKRLIVLLSSGVFNDGLRILNIAAIILIKSKNYVIELIE